MKARRYEPYRFVVKWIVGNMMYFREFKRDASAVIFQQYLIDVEGIDPAMIRILMK